MESDESRARAAEKMMIDIISSVPGFKPPSQARSRETTYAIVSAASHLLRTRSYTNIKMQDIAESAGCAVTAIYARFSDKNALLGAIHLLLLQEYRPILAEEIRASKFASSGLFGLACAFVTINEKFFTDNYNFVIAAITAKDGAVYRITSEILDDYSQRLSTVAAELMKVEVGEIVPAMRFAIHLVLSLYRDSSMAVDYFTMPSRESLAHLFTMVVERRLTR